MSAKLKIVSALAEPSEGSAALREERRKLIAERANALADAQRAESDLAVAETFEAAERARALHWTARKRWETCGARIPELDLLIAAVGAQELAEAEKRHRRGYEALMSRYHRAVQELADATAAAVHFHYEVASELGPARTARVFPLRLFAGLAREDMLRAFLKRGQFAGNVVPPRRAKRK